jgi:hypothetical protein
MNSLRESHNKHLLPQNHRERCQQRTNVGKPAYIGHSWELSFSRLTFIPASIIHSLALPAGLSNTLNAWQRLLPIQYLSFN